MTESPLDKTGSVRPRVGVQLYTLRDELGNGEESTVTTVLDRVAEIGYRWVELFPSGELGHFLGQSPDVLARMLEDRELGVLASHVPLDQLEHYGRSAESSSLEQALGGFRQIGCYDLVCPWLPPERRGDLASYRRLGRNLAKSADELAKKGFRLGYHNHEFELGAGDGLANLFAASGRSVFAELDVYWLAWAGVDPTAYLRACRAPVWILHMKDGALPDNRPLPAEEARFEALGDGDVDLRSLLVAARETGVSRLVVEQDFCSGSAFDAIARSHTHLESLLSELETLRLDTHREDQ